MTDEFETLLFTANTQLEKIANCYAPNQRDARKILFEVPIRYDPRSSRLTLTLKSGYEISLDYFVGEQEFLHKVRKNNRMPNHLASLKDDLQGDSDEVRPQNDPDYWLAQAADINLLAEETEKRMVRKRKRKGLSY